MSNLVKVPKDFYESATNVLADSVVLYDIPYIMKCAEGDVPDTEWAKPLYEFYKNDKRLYFQALINGYEVEQTPEDKVRTYYQNAIRDKDSGDHDLMCCGESVSKAVLFVLDAFTIRIEGVNI